MYLGAVVTPANQTEWDMLIEKHGIEAVKAALKRLEMNDKRGWPNDVGLECRRAEREKAKPKQQCVAPTGDYGAILAVLHSLTPQFRRAGDYLHRLAVEAGQYDLDFKTGVKLPPTVTTVALWAAKQPGIVQRLKDAGFIPCKAD